MTTSERQEALGHELGVAAKQGHLDRVQRLLSAGTAKEIPTLVMGMMMTPMNAAAYTNNVRPNCLMLAKRFQFCVVEQNCACFMFGGRYL